MKQIVMFVVLYLALWFLQKLLEILLDWIRHITDYHAAKLSLTIAEKEERLKKKYADDGLDDARQDTSCIGFHYTSSEDVLDDEDRND